MTCCPDGGSWASLEGGPSGANSNKDDADRALIFHKGRRIYMETRESWLNDFL